MTYYAMNIKGHKQGHWVSVVNDKGEFGFYPGEKTPYTPIGERRALVGAICALEFKPYEFDSRHFSVKRGNKITPS